MSKVRIDDAKRIAKSHGCDGVIILAIATLKNPSIQGVSYGSDRTKCQVMGRLLNGIIDKFVSGEIAP